MSPSPSTVIDENLFQYATVRQLEIMEAIASAGSIHAAAKQLGVTRTTIQDSLRSLKRKAAIQGYSPEHDMTHIVPDGFKVKGVSTYFDESGKKKGQWVKSSADEERRAELFQLWADSLAQTVKGLCPVVEAPKNCIDDLLVVIPIGDPHFGLRIWMHEGGANFDLDIAERLTCTAIDRLVLSGPDAKTAILLNLGDHFHADSQSNTTTAGTTVDVDGRWAKIQQVGLRSMIYCVMRLLSKHEKVIVRINRGNHDKHAAYALSLMLSCYFHNEKRVQVDLSPAAVWYYQFGEVLLASTHGDTIKGDKLMGVMAADQPKMWGSTMHRVWMVGHVHHVDQKEYPGGIVEYFRTLAPGDAWHHGQGYRSGRDMRLIVMHKQHGEVERHRVDAGMLT